MEVTPPPPPLPKSLHTLGGNLCMHACIQMGPLQAFCYKRPGRTDLELVFCSKEKDLSLLF